MPKSGAEDYCLIIRLTNIEAHGSPPVAEHIKLDDEREARTKERIQRVEEAVAAFRTMQVDVAKMSVKLDDLGRVLEEHAAQNRSKNP